jgi:hypothetical protein
MRKLHNRYQVLRTVGSQVRREILVDDVLDLVGIRKDISIQEIQDILDLDSNTTRIILDFLAKFDFIRLDGRNVSLNNVCKPIFEEVLER